MAAPQSLLGDARAFARDFPRDRMPRQYLWDVVDYVPLVIDSNLTGRGGWLWGSQAMGADAVAGILGSFVAGDKLVMAGANGRWYEVDQNSPYGITDRGALNIPKQNLVQGTNCVFNFDAAGANVPQIISYATATPSQQNMDPSAPKAPVGCVYKGYVVAGGVIGNENRIYFGPPGTILPGVAGAWDANSFKVGSRAVTALAAIRAAIIVFHAGSVERIRGSIPPHTGANDDDMDIEGLFDRVGCTQPLTIAYWNDNCIFADEHGVHITDGAVIRNLCSQGGILYFWRNLYSQLATIAACAFLDYYIVTIRTASLAVTLICDLNKRQWFRFSNVYSRCYVSSSGGTGMERAWASMVGTSRLARVGPMFFPTFGSTLNQDDDGTAVLPTLETPWWRIGREGRKRSRFAYLSYDSRTAPAYSSSKASPPEDGGPPEAPPEVLAAVAPVLAVDYVTNPSDVSYTSMGNLPPTSLYSRFKLPINRAPYGIGFRVRQLAPTTVTRIYDLAVESGGLEPSRE